MIAKRRKRLDRETGQAPGAAGPFPSESRDRSRSFRHVVKMGGNIQAEKASVELILLKVIEQCF
jgi:hypothetical protein